MRSLIGAAAFAAVALTAAMTVPTMAEDLVGAADVGYAPHIMQKPDGSFEGINVELGQEVAKRLGRTLKIVDQQYSGIFAGLNAKKYDFILAPVTATEERAKEMLFSEGYMESDYQFVIKKGMGPVKSLEDLKGKVISVNNGNLYDRWATQNADKYGWTVQRYGKNADAVQAVLTGRAFANMCNNSCALWTAKINPLMQASLVVPTGQVYTMAFRKDDKALRDKVDAALECMKKDGAVARILEKWLGEKPGPKSVANNPLPGYGQPGFEGYEDTKHEMTCK